MPPYLEVFMPNFDVLSSDINIYQHHALEASAGTGKTFAIEHLVVRLLLEDDPSSHIGPCVLSQILVITFTRAATRELKERIRSNIVATLELLRQAEQPNTQAPDYVRAILDEDPQSCSYAIRRLKAALADFDQAQIFTIHGFCARMLRECAAITSPNGRSGQDVDVPYEAIQQVIRNALRTELRPELVSPAQLERLLKAHRNDETVFIQALMHQVMRGVPIASPPWYTKQLERFQEAMESLLSKFPCSPTEITDDFHQQYPSYRKYPDMDADALNSSIERFAELWSRNTWDADDFESLIRDDVVFVQALDPARLKKRGPKLPEQLHCPELWAALQEHLVPIVNETRDTHGVFAIVAQQCQRLATRYMEQEELEGPDQLLGRMSEAVSEGAFCQSVQSRYRFAIVDEFQDTDPQQWHILRELFVKDDSQKQYLALVGDPKQAIYAFRRADIYTYVDACKQLPNANRASLSVNYRSRPRLVQAINMLFDEKRTPGLMDMPRDGLSLECPEVSAGVVDDEAVDPQGLGALHFFIAHGKRGRSKSFPTATMEQGLLLPFIVEEIGRLVDDEKRSYRDVAILVRDRYQAANTADFLQKWGIPAALERSGYLTDRPAYTAFVQLIDGFLHPRDTSALMQALGGPLVGWDHSMLRLWQSDEVPEKWQRRILQQVYRLRKLLLEGAVSSFTEEFLTNSWIEGSDNATQHILQQAGGLELYHDTIQIAELLAHISQRTQARSEGLLGALTELQTMAANDDERVRIQGDVARDAVRIMTMHISKGLEFPIVFALGLCRRSQIRERLFHKRDSDELVPIDSCGEGDPQLRAYREELDAEKVRQAYVAMTRAKDRLYVAVTIDAEGTQLEPGQAAPIELLLARLNQAPTDIQGVYSRIEKLNEDGLLKYVDSSPNGTMGYTQIQEGQYLLRKRPLPPPPLLNEPKAIDVRVKPRYLQSFTSLNARQSHHTEAREPACGSSPPHDYRTTTKNVHTLPAGPNTGIFVHSILESMPFELAQATAPHSELVDYIHPLTLAHGLGDWTGVIANMLSDALQTPLPTPSGSVALCDIPRSQQYREMEFIYSQDDDLIKGFIDLIFEHQGIYYIVDYKCNWLGDALEFYSPNNVREAMQSHGYELQAKIYSHALKTYLDTRQPNRAENVFGGCYYLFLRGMNSFDTTQSYGTHFCKPEVGQPCPG